MNLSESLVDELTQNAGSGTRKSFPDKRTAKRIAWMRDVLLIPMDGPNRGKPLSGRTREISISGISLYSPVPLHTGRKLIVGLPHPARTTLWVSCRVERWHPLADEEFLIGVSFLQLLTSVTAADPAPADVGAEAELPDLSPGLAMADEAERIRQAILF